MLTFIKHFSIGKKLAILLFLPMVLIALLAGQQLLNLLEQVQTAQRINKIVIDSTQLSNYISALQTERGTSGVFLVSRGTQFSEEMQQARRNLDDARQKLSKALVAEHANNWAEIENIRPKIDNFDLTLPEITKVYTDQIDTLISALQSDVNKVADLNERQGLSNLVSLMNWIERAGRERAIISLVLTEQKLSDELIRRWQANSGAQQIFKTEITESSWLKAQNIRIEISEIDANGYSQQIESIQKTKVGETINGLPQQWFQVATKRISSLRDVQNNILEVLNNDSETMVNDSTRLMWLISVVLVVLITLVLWVSVYISRAIRNSLREIDGLMSYLMLHDLTHRSNVQTRDEFGHLSTGLNQVTGELNNVLLEIRSATDQVAAAAEEASAITELTKQGVSQQQSDTEQAATAMHEMSATVADVAMSTAQAAEQADHIQERTAAGQRQLELTRGLIADLTLQVQTTGEQLDTLYQHTQEINSVLDVIKGVAEQTNLLALNAAIEAARAGEQGRGFAVVADEVRHLAQRTQQSTIDIRRMIDNLQNTAKQSVNSMNISVEKANSGNEQMGQMAVLLTAIVDGVHTIHDRTTQIASAAEEQSTVAEQININITRISDVSMQTSSGASQTAEMAAELARLAAELQRLVAKFNLAARF